MSRNTLAGKGKGKSRSAKYYAANPKARKKKQDYDKKYHSTPERKKYRAELNAKNRKAGTYGNKDNKDMSHRKNGGLVKESQTKNRARNRGKK
jgi:hypothetical protein|tara:strand:+ start:657 stop:935 length:279 start_codon:yes stop_codon:yes gene_type:complete